MGFNRITPANQVESWQLAVPARLHPPLRDEDPRHLCVRYWMRLPKTFDKLEDHKLIFIDGHGSKPTPISLHLIVAVFASKVKVSKSQMANVCSRSAVVGDSDHWK